MAMQGSLLDFLIGWIFIPWRIFRELYKNVYPPVETSIVVTHSLGDHAGTIDKREYGHWTKLSDRWWDPEGDMALLRGFNSCRIPMILQTYVKFLAEENTIDDSKPLRGVRICDVGCGAGFVAEPLVAEYGACVTAIDVVSEVIEAAQTHWNDNHESNVGPEYLCTSVEKLLAERGSIFDMVLCLEVVDHVGNMPQFVKHVCGLLRPGGCAIFSTINRTLPALLTAIIGAEHILRIVPMDTHHLYRFVKPVELSNIIAKEGLKTVSVTGCFPANVFARRPHWIDVSFTGVTYVLTAIKTK